MTQVRQDNSSPRREPFTKVILALAAVIQEQDARIEQQQVAIDIQQERIAFLEGDNERLQEHLTLTEAEAERWYREHLEAEARRP